ncbi:Os04g0555800 [Oryza sativa Japonica Group]|uniref:Os04g0555800 protein n=1 Tax=Oryza sativa subsp. japonica TaxID=39947 RepID=B7F357_ORYSJ|nr:hypothetical protein EE612_024849 [Oryza sativa]BAG99054.1 unnamed protein product [Oryza sativa Japonica Group]BAS90427.1 Os04g0555800 [Oryza sativa Japonica Group]
MANKRQREARKRFREANPGLFPANPTPPADGTKKKKNNKKSMFKKTSKAGGGGAGRSKHPLRVPGMRPGERCFICKAADHVAKVCPEKSLWEKNKVSAYHHSSQNPCLLQALGDNFCSAQCLLL